MIIKLLSGRRVRMRIKKGLTLFEVHKLSKKAYKAKGDLVVFDTQYVYIPALNEGNAVRKARKLIDKVYSKTPKIVKK